MTASDDGGGSAMTVKELVLEVRDTLNDYLNEHRSLHEEMRSAMIAHTTTSEVDALRLTQTVEEHRELRKEVEELKDFRLKTETTIEALKWVAGGGSLVGSIGAIIGLLALMGVIK